jgi:hypothetical protein
MWTPGSGSPSIWLAVAPVSRATTAAEVLWSAQISYLNQPILLFYSFKGKL